MNKSNFNDLFRLSEEYFEEVECRNTRPRYNQKKHITLPVKIAIATICALIYQTIKAIISL